MKDRRCSAPLPILMNSDIEKDDAVSPIRRRRRTDMTKKVLKMEKLFTNY